MNTALALSRLVTFGSVTVLIGALCFIPLAWPGGHKSRRLHRLTRGALVVAAVSSLVSLLLYGPYASGGSIAAVVDMGVQSQALETIFGAAVIFRVMLLCVLAALIWLPKREPYNLGFSFAVVALLVGVAFSLSLSGHANTKDALAVAADMLHVMAAGIWLGGIVVLGAVVLPHRPTMELASVIPAFSSVAFRCVIALAVTGTYQVIAQTGSLVVVGDNAYGNLVTAKMIAFAVVLGLGAASREWVKRRYVYNFEGTPEEGLPDRELDAHFRKGLRKSVLTETVIAGLVLAITAALVSSNPMG